MRGEVLQLKHELARAGIIPAGAGRSKSVWPSASRMRDHPRGCGEKQAFRRAEPRFEGSSPRVRGEGLLPVDTKTREGIIPAGAGKRLARRLRPSAPRDHPRGCGEKRSRMELMAMSRGSSPRVRGKADPPRWCDLA